MNRILLTAGVMAVLVYAMVLGVKWLSPKIEDDIANRVAVQLAQNGQLWADVKVSGREVTLAGEAPTAAAKDMVLADMSRVFGIAKVTDAMTVAGDTSATAVDVLATTPKTKAERLKAKAAAKAQAEAEASYTLVMTKMGDKIGISGTVPTEADKELLTRLSSTHYGADKIDMANVRVVDGAPAGWRVAAGSVLFNLVNMENATATLSGREVMVSGTVLDKQFSAQMEEAISAALPKTYKAAFAVEEATPVAVADVVAAPAVSDTAPAVVAEVTPAPAAEPEVSATAVVASASAPVVVPAPVADIAPAAGGDTCATLPNIAKERLHFDFDKAELRTADAPVVARVATQLRGCQTEQPVTLAGYTDVTGSKLYNTWLSQQRADAARRALIREGVAKDRVKAVGYGEKTPVASNKTREGRAANRRVEFHLPVAK